MRTRVVTVICVLALATGIAVAQDYPWCASLDDITAAAAGGDLILQHRNATYNCCPDSFTFEVTVAGDSLVVTEHENLTMPCDCLCCYDLTATVAGLSPGEWPIIYRWFDDGIWDWREWRLSAVIEETSAAAKSIIVRSDASGCLGPSGIPQGGAPARAEITLLQNTPNPFNPQTTITFAISEAAAVSLRVFDLSGRLVSTLLDNEVVAQGHVEVVWNGRDAAGRLTAAGTYFYRLDVAGDSRTKRMLLMK